MQRVLDHIDKNCTDCLDLETLSRVAAFSKFHFHRQFAATFGLSVHHYVQLVRLKQAAHRLLSDRARSVTSIAIDAGYGSPDAFARAFRREFEQSPSSFRVSPKWETWLAAHGTLAEARRSLVQPKFGLHDVTIRHVAPTAVAIMEHRGERKAVRATARLFHAWRKAHDLSPLVTTSFTVFRSEQEPAVATDYALDLCVATDRSISGDKQVRAGEIPGGRCAVMRVDGASNDQLQAALFLYRDWLPSSGEEVREFPMYCQRRLMLPDNGSDSKVFAELFLPIK